MSQPSPEPQAASEPRRSCPNCGSPAFRVRDVRRSGMVTIRLYKCGTCGKRCTSEVTERFTSTDYPKRYLADLDDEPALFIPLVAKAW